ncbi:HFL326Wp [Eremothecium sinecaudum]|uniref:HFL326Wp n=1 Tax=Eremothecium sinecaudum TaxID=45286 RepID=A0A0X8HU95_9SACH|nr:HFL326Wp [Eremothecium sinecaudum]AMD21530.1 HFL326Wp [Eremothecium sinecaudum]
MEAIGVLNELTTPSTNENPEFIPTNIAPEITPPNADLNPNIWKSSKPPGTVFILVGAASIAIFIALIAWYVITEHISRRDTKKLLYESEEKGFDDAFSTDNELFDGREQPVKPPVYPEMKPKLLMDQTLQAGQLFGVSQNTPLERLPVPEDDKWLEGQRKSMYISPTIEVMNQKRMHVHSLYDRPTSMTSIDDQSYQQREIATAAPLMGGPGDWSAKSRNKNRYAMNLPFDAYTNGISALT